MNLDAFELLKNNGRTNELAWLRNIPFISFGFVSALIDDITVEVTPVIQDDPTTTMTRTVTLLSLSSAFFELKIKPKLDDMVMMFSPQYYRRDMFNDVGTRAEEEKVLLGDSGSGYTYRSMVGILMTTAKEAAKLSLELDETGVSADANTDMALAIHKAFTMGFVARDGQKHPLTFYVDENHPTSVTQNSDVTVEQGIRDMAEGNRKEVPVNVKKVVHGKGVIDYILRSVGNLIVGIGNDESKDDAEERRLSFTAKIGEETSLEATIGKLLSITSTIGDEASIKTTLGKLLSVITTIAEEASVSTTMGDKFNITVTAGEEGQVNITLGKSPVNFTSTDAVNIKADDFNVDSAKPISIKGTGTQLGSGAIVPHMNNVKKNWGMYPMFIPPAPWPMGAPVPPVPPLINMALAGLTKKMKATYTSDVSPFQKALD